VKIEALGHVVLRVSNLARAERFYAGLLGLPICARLEQDGLKMVFFSLGDHHNLALSEVGEHAGRPDETSVGLHHVAFKIGTSLGELRGARDELTAAGVAATPVDHDVTKSLYFADPDGNGIEVYVDVSDAWRVKPQRVANARPFVLES